MNNRMQQFGMIAGGMIEARELYLIDAKLSGSVQRVVSDNDSSAPISLTKA